MGQHTRFWNLLYTRKLLLINPYAVFGVSDKVRFKPAGIATGTSYKIEIFLVASFFMVLSNKRITKVLIRLCRRAGWPAPLLFTKTPEDRFSCIEAHIQPDKSFESRFQSSSTSINFVYAISK